MSPHKKIKLDTPKPEPKIKGSTQLSKYTKVALYGNQIISTSDITLPFLNKNWLHTHFKFWVMKIAPQRMGVDMIKQCPSSYNEWKLK